MSTTDMTKNLSLSSATSSSHDPSPLEMDTETFYHLGMLAVEIATEYLESIPQKPVYRPMTPAELQLLLYQQLPEYGRSPEALFDFFEQHILPHAMATQHPPFPPCSTPPAAPTRIPPHLPAPLNTPT